jgi:hypothetical protein
MAENKISEDNSRWIPRHDIEALSEVIFCKAILYVAAEDAYLFIKDDGLFKLSSSKQLVSGIVVKE